MPVPVVVLAPAVDAPADQTLLELTLRPADATPENIILYPRPVSAIAGLVVLTLTAMGVSDSWPTFNQVTQGVEWYQDGVKYVGTLGAGAAVFPTEPDVRTGVVYGPGGTDYTGTLVQPSESDVLLGVSYGADGTEFTGTAVSGSSSGGNAILMRRR